jgi:glycosyltransferase involved in cell wall biosynthesis
VRIALVATLVSAISEPQQGGTQAIVADLASGLTRRGHAVDLFAATGSAVPGVNVVDTGVDPASLGSALVRPGRGSRRSDAVSAAFGRVYEMVANGQYDLVHNHGFDAAAIDLALGLDPPVVHTLHMPTDPEVGAALRRAAAGARPPTVVAVSASEARTWSTMTPVDEVVRNGVDVSAIEWSEGPGQGALFAGRLSPEKGALEAIEICRLAGVPLTLAGSVYDPAYADEVRRRCDGDPAATLLEAVPRQDLWRLMARSAVVVCPAMWDEPFGLVAAEAQAAGTPVVAFNRGALPEVVVDGVTGALVAPGDIAAAVEAVALRGDFSREFCRRHAEQDLDFAATLDGYEALYRRILGVRP